MARIQRHEATLVCEIDKRWDRMSGGDWHRYAYWQLQSIERLDHAHLPDLDMLDTAVC